ncbi:hypothetical protein [Paractinoplanes rishiriensis]|uniref:Uncharacterized protein n=1 Tax=Paractinoplanes rishiriensis TaxID=1050105 RepID=A0A919MZ31_9ACTN|nr:hypothetical protein [Actinoplanes rishiriensis]GIF00974.1 hypothetical protein Ari01nite_84380 [Actinoplanes rishiriensis]
MKAAGLGLRRLYTITFPTPRPEFIGRDDVLFELILDMDGTFGGMAEEAGPTSTVARTYRLDEAARAISDFDREHIVGKLVVLI